MKIQIRHFIFLFLLFIFGYLIFLIYKQEIHYTTKIFTQTNSSKISKLPPVPPQVVPFVTRPQLIPKYQQLPKDIEAIVDNQCRAAIVVDWSNKNILFEKDSNKTYHIASLTKMFTALEMFHMLKDFPEKFHLDMMIKISKNINKNVRKGGEVDLDPRETFSLEDLFSFMIIHSANDAAYQIAETLGNGDYKNFIKRMNSLAKEIGWNSFKFYNPHGLPEFNNNNNLGSARDLAELTGTLLKYPIMMKYASMPYKQIPAKGVRKTNRDLYNRNELIAKKHPYFIGMKTGTTASAGFCISTVAQKDNRIIIVVLLGCHNNKIRINLSEQLTHWALGI